MKAGKMIVANHSTKAIDLLLPELETGLFDESWRIRQRSVSSFQLFSSLRLMKSTSAAPYNSWEISCSESLESPVSPTRTKREKTIRKKRVLEPTPSKRLLPTRLERSDEIESWLRSTSFVKIRLVEFDKPPSEFGKRWCRILLVPFERFFRFSVSLLVPRSYSLS